MPRWCWRCWGRQRIHCLRRACRQRYHAGALRAAESMLVLQPAAGGRGRAGPVPETVNGMLELLQAALGSLMAVQDIQHWQAQLGAAASDWEASPYKSPDRLSFNGPPGCAPVEARRGRVVHFMVTCTRRSEINSLAAAVRTAYSHYDLHEGTAGATPNDHALACCPHSRRQGYYTSS